jgi:hypothetical protein
MKFAFQLWGWDMWLGYTMMCLNFGFAIRSAWVGCWISVVHIALAIALYRIISLRNTQLVILHKESK